MVGVLHDTTKRTQSISQAMAFLNLQFDRETICQLPKEDSNFDMDSSLLDIHDLKLCRTGMQSIVQRAGLEFIGRFKFPHCYGRRQNNP